MEEVENIKMEVSLHFASRFVELDGDVSFNCLSVEDKMILEAPFLVEEIKEVIWISDCDKSSGPNVFPLGFFKICWSFISQEAVPLVRDFHARGKLLKASSASFFRFDSQR